jgi:glycosyltransferase involved in cell wall biosynthesis
VLVHAPGAGDYFRANGVAAVTHLPNWVGTARFAGHDPSEARQELLPGLEGKLVALFAGVLGPAQGLDSLVALAAALQDREDIRFVFAGEGACRAWLAREVRALSNVTLLPFQPPEVYPRLVAASDVFLVSLSARVRYPVIPSKIGDGLAAGKALLAALPGGDAATLVRDAQAGVVVEPGDAAGLARALCELAGSPRLRARLGESGRRFARTHLERELVLARARSLLVDALQGAP